MSFNAPSAEPPENGSVSSKPEKSKDRSLFSLISSLLDLKKKPHSLKGRAIVVQKRIEETLCIAQQVIDSLEEQKLHLLAEFGESSHGFIAKAIDPMISQSKQLIQDLASHDATLQLPDVLENVIESVGLYAQFSDEKKLIRKIVSEAINNVHLSIQRDCEILQNYQRHLIMNGPFSQDDKDQLNLILDAKLAPIFVEFSKLLDQSIEPDDVRQLFLWKGAIDTRRGALTELGLLTVDALISYKESYRKDLKPSKDVPEVDSEFSALGSSINEVNHTLDDIREMEERALDLLQLVDQLEIFDRSAFADIETLLVGLKEEIQTLEKHNFTYQEHQTAIMRLQESTHRLEQLLKKRRREFSDM